jgi:hypothetical protein
MRVFLLSPASSSGERARIVMRKEARFGLAERLRSPEGAPIGEVFAFLSGLYFRGKLAYARAFSTPVLGVPGALVITPNRGLLALETAVSIATLRAFSLVDIHEGDPRYRRPRARDARVLARAAGPHAEVVLLGSVATGKYVEVLARVFGERLLFPSAFVGRGDMSRGGLMLRAAREGKELDYVPVLGAVRHGPRPPRLPRVPRIEIEET